MGRARVLGSQESGFSSLARSSAHNRKTIQFTSHALVKIQVLRDHGMKVSKETIENTIRAPDQHEWGYGERRVAQRAVDEDHVLRVVYEETEAEIIVITMYPGKRRRYEKNKI
jgi:hypothetical protein